MRYLPGGMVAAAAWVALAGGCGGSSESGFAGSYMVTQKLEQDTGCDLAGSPVSVAPDETYFKLADDQLLGVPVVGWHACTAAGSCDNTLDLFLSFGQQSGGQWTSVMSSAASSNTGCTWYYEQRQLGRVDAATIQVSEKHYTDSQATPAAGSCTTDEAQRRGTSMPCVEKIVITARRQAM
jgi:hypothetical protein